RPVDERRTQNLSHERRPEHQGGPAPLRVPGHSHALRRPPRSTVGQGRRAREQVDLHRPGAQSRTAGGWISQMPRLNPFAWGRTKLTKLWQGVIDGHVVSLAWSHALGVIAAASADGPIALFDAKTGQIRATLPGHGFGTANVAWSADGKQLASAGQDGKIR